MNGKRSPTGSKIVATLLKIVLFVKRVSNVRSTAWKISFNANHRTPNVLVVGRLFRSKSISAARYSFGASASTVAEFDNHFRGSIPAFCQRSVTCRYSSMGVSSVLTESKESSMHEDFLMVSAASGNSVL